MNTLRPLLLVTLALFSLEAAALTAVVEVNESPEYSARKATDYRGAELTAYYAPLPVFFEGWKSTGDIVDYEWDFGDGSVKRKGFNAAHVYERPGTYMARLTVTDSGGQTDFAEMPITVFENNGKTYYVDSEIGADSNPGTSPEQAWRTATHAFRGMRFGRYGPGDRILFRRGQVFEMKRRACVIPHGNCKQGYHFGAFGTGPKPVMQQSGIFETPDNSVDMIIYLAGVGGAHIGFADLEFRMEDADGGRAGFFYAVERVFNVLFLRVDVKQSGQVFTLSGTATGSKSMGGIFLQGCTIEDVNGSHMFMQASRLAIQDCFFDYATNHIAYLAYVNCGVFTGTTYSRPAYGRHALRITGVTNDQNSPAGRIWIADNLFKGWIDPRTGGPTYSDGTRYNYVLVHLAPNTPDTVKTVENVVFEDNALLDAEVVLNVGSYENMIIRKNAIMSRDVRAAPRFVLGSIHGYDERPLKNILIEDNLLWSASTADNLYPFLVVMRQYTAQPYNGSSVHENVVLRRNRSVLNNGCFLSLPDSDEQMAQVTSDQHRLYARNANELFRKGSVGYNLAGWRSLSGQDGATLTLAPSVLPTSGSASAPATAASSPIAITYSGAQDNSGSGIKQVHLWVKKDYGAWRNTGVTSPGVSGSFSYDFDKGAGTYYFALQAEDNAGSLAEPRVDTADTQTVYTPPAPTDTTPPTAGTASSPANASASPIVVSFSGAGDEPGGSGLKEVRLWAKKGSAGSWQATSHIAYASSGVFNYTGMTAQDTYYFATRARDNADNYSAVPTGNGQTQTVFTGTVGDSTPPTPGTLSAPAFARTSPVAVSFSGAADNAGGSGLKEVRLWYKRGSTGSWLNSGLASSAAAGTFNFTPVGDGAYYFHLVATDNADNASAAAAGDGMGITLYDTVAPTAPGLNVPATATQSPIAVTYSGASDAASGLKRVLLWVKKGSGSWVNTGMGNAAGSGTFNYTGMTGDDIYGFVVQAEDNAGNLSAAPSGSGSTCLYDTTAPTVGSVSSPAYANATPFNVSYSGVSDGTGSGLKYAYLWLRREGAAWENSNLRQTTPSGTFNVGPGTDGTYYFAVRTEDNAGNLSPVPTGNGQTSTVFDRVAPVAGTLSAPASRDSSPITVTYSGASDARSGLKTVHLWVKKGATGQWTNSGLASAAASGSFAYTGMTGNDTYYFGLQAEDNAGNFSAAPSGSGGGSTVYNSTFSAGTASSPQYVTSGAITVTYAGALDTSGGGLKYVYLWFKKGATGTWTNTGMRQTGASGSFSFNGTTGDAIYYFATRAENNAGQFTAQPSGSGDTATTYDTTPPNPGAVSSPTHRRNAPITVTYSGASDNLSGLKEVRLWAKKGYAGAWQDTGLRQTTPEGSFDFGQVAGDDVYFFFLQAVDNAGLASPQPSDSLVFGN